MGGLARLQMIACTCTFRDTISLGANGAIFKVLSPPQHAWKMWICLLAWVHLFFRVNNTINFPTTGAILPSRTGRGAACWLWNQCEGFYMDQASWREGPLRNGRMPARGVACCCRDVFLSLLNSRPLSHRLSEDTFITNRHVNDPLKASGRQRARSCMPAGMGKSRMSGCASLQQSVRFLSWAPFCCLSGSRVGPACRKFGPACRKFTFLPPYRGVVLLAVQLYSK